MLFWGQQPPRNGSRSTRRGFLQAGGSTVLGLSLADLVRLRAAGGESPAGKVRSVLLLWLWGGPSHLDTFDPKPNAAMEYRGPFSPIATQVAGLRICELFPKLAKEANRFSIIRSMHTGSNDHGVAGTIGLTGSIAGAVGLGGAVNTGAPRPTTGSVVARVRGDASRRLPPFLVVGGKLHQGKRPIVGEGGGALGGRYDPFRLEYDPAHGTRVPALQLPNDLTTERLTSRQKLLGTFSAFDIHIEQYRAAGLLDDYRAQAFTMLTSPTSARAFDLAAESPSLRDRYGRTRFGQSCLLGRRLVEAGVPFVQVNWSDHVEAEEDAGDGGWDHHYRNFQIMQDRHAPWLDQALSTLLSDMEERGLLEGTLVLALGEFGRSPKINSKAGRDHWEHCYSALVAGGGTRGGRVLGSSDARGEHPHDTPITPADLAATIHHAVGITSAQAQSLGVAVAGKPVEELY